MKKSKFTAVDAVIILVAVLVLVVGAMKLAPRFMNKTTGDAVDCKILISSAEPQLGEAIKVGDEVTLSLTEKDGGVVKDVVVRPAEKIAFDSIKGEYVKQEIDNKCDIEVTVSVQANISDTAVTVGSTVLKVGAETPVRGKGYAAMGYAIELND